VNTVDKESRKEIKRALSYLAKHQCRCVRKTPAGNPICDTCNAVFVLKGLLQYSK